MASRSLGTLTWDLIAKIGGFQRGMDQASRIADKRMRDIQQSMKRTAAAAGLYLGKEIGRAVLALGRALKSGIDRADELYNASQKIGVSVEALSGLEYAAKQAGVGLEELQGAIGKMVKVQTAAAQGNDAAAASFAAFKIELLDGNKHLRDGESILLDWAEVFAKLPDGAEKTALAMRVFGKAGAELIPFLNEGREGIKNLTDEARDLGLVLSTETGRQADQFNDQLDALKGALTGAATEAGAKLLPDLIRLADGLLQSTKEGNGLMRAVDLLTDVLSGAGWVMEKIDQLARGLGLGFAHAATQAGNFVSALDAVRQRDLNGIRDAMAKAVSDGQQFIEMRAEILHGTGQADGPSGPVQWIDPPKKGGRDANATLEAARKLLAVEHDSTGASKAAAEARRKAAEAAREQAERERELAEAIEHATEASAEFKLKSEDLADTIAGPLAVEQRKYERQVEDLKKLWSEGAAPAAGELAAALENLRLQHEKDAEEIRKGLDPAGQRLEQMREELRILQMQSQAERDRAAFKNDNPNATAAQVEEAAGILADSDKVREAISSADNFRSHWEDAFASILDGSKSVGEAFKDLATQILADIARMLAKQWVEQLFGSYGTTGSGSSGGWLMSALSAFGSAKGNVFSGGMPVHAFAKGGVVNQHSFFPMANGQIGSIAEGNKDEGILPLARDSHGRLGVRSTGGGSVMQTINVNGYGKPDRRTFGQIEASATRGGRRALARNRV